LAPEVLQGQGKKASHKKVAFFFFYDCNLYFFVAVAYGKEVDWWSLGTFLYELLNVNPPFYDKDVHAMYKKVLTAKLRFPPHVSDNAKDLIKKLLDRDPKTRLADIETIKKHPFFKQIDWYKKKLKKKEELKLEKSDAFNFYVVVSFARA
jgi:serine/threonine protein kinase